VDLPRDGGKTPSPTRCTGATTAFCLSPKVRQNAGCGNDEGRAANLRSTGMN